MVTEAGVALIDRDPDSGWLTVSSTVTLLLTLPLVPTTVRVEDPTGVLVEVLTPRDRGGAHAAAAGRDADRGGREAGRREPPGRPVAVRSTAPAKPAVEDTVTVQDAVWARSIDWLAGEAWSVTSGLAAAA